MPQQRIDGLPAWPQLWKGTNPRHQDAALLRPEARRSPNASPGTAPSTSRTERQPTHRPLRAVAGKADGPMPAEVAPHLASTPDRLNAVAVAGAGERGPVVLDTVAQLPEAPKTDAATTLQKRAKSKARTESVVEGLVALDSGAHKAFKYTNTLHYGYASTLRCAGVLSQLDGKVTGRYCGNRWCAVCNRIRTAKLRTAYAPELASWPDAQFVTLTVPNVPSEQLHDAVREMLKAVRMIADSIRRTDGLAWKAVRKLEVTYSTKRRDYHHHLHLLVAGKAQADALVRRWLAMFPEANAGAQKVVPCVGPNAMLELFKYLTKQTVKDADGRVTAPPARALDCIYRAVRKLRTIQPMGFTVAPKTDVVQDEDAVIELDASTPAPAMRSEPVRWEWFTTLTDWVDLTTGEVLSGYEPTPDEVRTLQRIRADAGG